MILTKQLNLELGVCVSHLRDMNKLLFWRAVKIPC